MRVELNCVLMVLLLASACTAPAPSQLETAPPDASLVQTTPTLATATPPTPAEINAPLVNNPPIVALHMFDDLNGWGMTASAVLRTNDGGATWYNISPHGETGFGYSAGTTFLDVLQAWVLIADAIDPLGTGILYRTGDGGKTWNSSKVPFGSADLSFLDAQNGWAMVGLGVGAGSMGVAIYRTSDSGANWDQVYTNDLSREDAAEGLPLSGIKNHLTPRDTHTAWISGVVYAPETFYLFRTMDNGRTWTQQPLPFPPGMQGADLSIEHGLFFFSSQDALLPVRFSGEADRTAFYSTHDGGQSWEFLSSMPGAGAVDFYSSSEGVFWTSDQFFFTIDGGRTWSSVSPEVLFGETFAGMDFVSANTGWVWTYDLTGRYSLYKTMDGGFTWTPLEN